MKHKWIIFVICACFSHLYASDWMAELRAGYFYPTSHKFRKIYKSGGVEGEFEVARIFKQNWIGWGNINYFQRNGHSIGFHDKTSIKMIPMSLGIKYQFLTCKRISPYLGFGATYTVSIIKNDSDFVKRHVTKGGFGFVVKSVMYIKLAEHVLLDIFADYYYQKIHFYDPGKVDMGGFRMGAGLGYGF